MERIAHRGNTHGRKEELENSPDYILDAMARRFDCEVDVWYFGTSSQDRTYGWYLGHDQPQYKIPFSFLSIAGLWVHCKNSEALQELVNSRNDVNFFWHQEDDYALTSKGYIWSTKPPEIHRPEKFSPDTYWHATSRRVLMIPFSQKDFLTLYNMPQIPYMPICSDWVGMEKI